MYPSQETPPLMFQMAQISCLLGKAQNMNSENEKNQSPSMLRGWHLSGRSDHLRPQL